MSFGTQRHNIPWSSNPGSSGVSLAWAVCTLLLWLGHNCCGCAGGLGWHPGQLVVRPGLNCCGCLGGGVWSLAGCVQGFAVTAVGILAVGAGSLSDWLQGPAMTVVSALCMGLGFRNGNHFEGTLVPARSAHRVGWDGSHLGWACWTGQILRETLSEWGT